LLLTGLLSGLLSFSGCNPNRQPGPRHDTPTRADTTTLDPKRSNENLIRSGLQDWAITNFGGEGEVVAAAGEIRLSMGYPMTGITWKGGPLPTENYQISLEAKRIDGNDFFCGLTFPVGQSHCTLILGGWGGSLVGLSCIDGDDAANNGTKIFRNFQSGQWYRINLYIDRHGIEVKLDDEVIIDQARKGHNFTVRNETLPCRPLGICSFQTRSAIRNLSLETLE